MPKNIMQYEILISCPGDVKEEVEIIHEIVHKFNSEFSKTLRIMIQERHWETDSYPASGDKPQEILNKQFVNDCDAVVAIFWTRFGTPTDEYGSGTEEEIEKMIADGKQVFMYFSDVPVSLSQIDKDQYEKIQQFKEKYKDKGLYWTYNKSEEFKELFYAHLTKYFLSLSAVIENENSKKPDLKVELVDAKTNMPIKTSYKFEYPIGTITWRELSEDDIFKDIEEYVTIDDINKYNEALPPKDEIELYNKQHRLYENAQNNRYDFVLLLTNIGNAKANEIYVDLYFPKEILVYYDDDIEYIKELEEKPKMPENPIWKAMEEIDKRRTKTVMGDIYGIAATDRLLKQADILNNWGFNNVIHTPLHTNLNLSKLVNPKRYDYYIENNKKLSLHRDNLLHTRQYNSDTFSLIFTSCGEFEIKYSVMCEEWNEPIEGQFQIKIEY